MRGRSGALPGGFSVDVKPNGPKDADKAPDVDDRVQQLFSRLGGEGKLTIERFTDDGKREYCGRVPVTAEVGENLEEEIARRFGGGRYYVIGFIKGAYVGCAEVNLSKSIKPVDEKKEEQRREEPRQSFDMMQWLAMTEAREEKARQAAQQQAQAMAQQQQAMLQVILTTQANQTQQMMGVFTVLASALSGKSEPAVAAPNGMAQLMEAVNAIQTVKQMTGTDAPALVPETTMAERVLGMAVTPIASRLGDMIAEQMKPKPAVAAPSPPVGAAAASPAPALAASNPGAGGVSTPRHVPPPPAAMPSTEKQKLPSGVTPLTAEELRERSKARRPMPTAPSASDVESNRK